MSVGMKITLIVVVVFAATLAVYYGWGSGANERRITTDNPPLDPMVGAQREDASNDPGASLDSGAGDSEVQFTDTLANGGLLAGSSFAASSEDDPFSELSQPPLDPLAGSEPQTLTPSPFPPLAKGGANFQRSLDPPTQTKPRYTVYTIREFDTLWFIAEDWFGDGTKWTLIRDANPNVNPERLLEGQTLRLPSKTATQASLDNDAVRSSGGVAAGGFYIVKDGDSLTTIAQHALGSATQWRALYDANRTAIGPDPDRLRLGMKLRLP